MFYLFIRFVCLQQMSQLSQTYLGQFKVLVPDRLKHERVVVVVGGSGV